MPAHISLAFPVAGGLAEVSAVLDTLGAAGPLVVSEGTGTAEVAVGRFPATLRAYQEEGWTSVTLDIERPVYDRLASDDRPAALEELLAVAAAVGAAAGCDYVHIDEEAESEVGPGQWDANQLMGITLVRRGHVSLAAARARPDVLQTRELTWGVALLRRLDPVPELG